MQVKQVQHNGACPCNKLPVARLQPHIDIYPVGNLSLTVMMDYINVRPKADE